MILIKFDQFKKIRAVTVIFVENGFGGPSSYPGVGFLRFTTS